MFKLKYICILTLLVFGSAGFSFLDNLGIVSGEGARLEAARRSRKSSNKSKKTDKKSDDKSSDSSEESKDDSGLLQDLDKAKSYMPDIYRCPDCGYEQDEPGFCPDHSTLELVKVISDVKDPLAPTELDGNEDILVDVPLHLEFKKDDIESKKEDEKKVEDSKTKSSKKSKKSK